MRKASKWVFALVAVMLVVAMFGMTGCTKKAETGKETEQSARNSETSEFKLVEEGKLLVGSDTSFPPFEFMEGDVAKGFDVDLMNAIGEDLGLEVVFKTETFDTLWGTLAAGGKFDVIASAMFANEERGKLIDFSDPYGSANQAIVVKTGSAIKTEADLVGKKISVQSGTIGAQWVKENVKDATVIEPKTAPDQIVALQAGNVDAAVNDAPVMNWYAQDKSKNITVIKEIPSPDEYVFGVGKDNGALKDAINASLKKLKENGEYASIFKKWFGVEPPE